MLCCGQCFQDRWLQDQLIPQLSEDTGKCPTCGSEGQLLVDARQLGDYFETLCGIYVAGSDGKVLVDWLIDDWQLFHLHHDTANTLLAKILDDGERVRQRLVPSERCQSDRLVRWDHLREELRHKNRFFPQTDFDHDRLENLLGNLVARLDERFASWYRARIQHNDVAYSADQMGAPPESVASHGRANPAGIPYLYLGSAVGTAIAEVRPHPGETVCVAQFTLQENLAVVDLRDPREVVSPFLLGDEIQIARLRGDMPFLERLGNELTTPVIPNAAAIEYTPSQYICEFIKKCGYAGVLYSSSVSDGVNLALFNPGDASVGGIQQFVVESVTVQASEIGQDIR